MSSHWQIATLYTWFGSLATAENNTLEKIFKAAAKITSHLFLQFIKFSFTIMLPVYAIRTAYWMGIDFWKTKEMIRKRLKETRRKYPIKRRVEKEDEIKLKEKRRRDCMKKKHLSQ